MSSDVTDMLDQQDQKNRYEALKKMLKTHVVRVDFTKADGTESSMVCTLMPEILEKFPVNQKPLSPKVPDDTVRETIRVWNIEKKAWRSFRLDSVLDVYTLPMYTSMNQLVQIQNQR
jgi:hypothetical protein